MYRPISKAAVVIDDMYLSLMILLFDCCVVHFVALSYAVNCQLLSDEIKLHRLLCQQLTISFHLSTAAAVHIRADFWRIPWVHSFSFLPLSPFPPSPPVSFLLPPLSTQPTPPPATVWGSCSAGSGRVRAAKRHSFWAEENTFTGENDCRISEWVSEWVSQFIHSAL